jgi:predicted HTH transcriptional regulator
LTKDPAMTNWIEIEHIDALPVRGSSLDDLDMARVTAQLQRARTLRTTDPLAYLQERQGVVAIGDAFVPTLGGLLCFGRRPQRHLPYTGVSLTRYSGHAPNSQQVIDIRDLEGTLFDLIDQAEEYAWTQSNHGFRLEAGPRRVPVDQYPRTVLRELIVNAVAHRDYRVAGSRVKIELFRNIIEWSSPGGLPPGITVENILKSQYTRNPVIVAFLFDAGYIEQRGMGLDTVVQELAGEGLPYPDMEDTGASFMIRVTGHGTVERHAELGLSEDLARVFTLIEQAGSSGIKAKSLADRTQVPLRTMNRRLQQLVELGVIVRVGATSDVRYYLADQETKLPAGGRSLL